MKKKMISITNEIKQRNEQSSLRVDYCKNQIF